MFILYYLHSKSHLWQTVNGGWMRWLLCEKSFLANWHQSQMLKISPLANCGWSERSWPRAVVTPVAWKKELKTLNCHPSGLTNENIELKNWNCHSSGLKKEKLENWIVTAMGWKMRSLTCCSKLYPILLSIDFVHLVCLLVVRNWLKLPGVDCAPWAEAGCVWPGGRETRTWAAGGSLRSPSLQGCRAYHLKVRCLLTKRQQEKTNYIFTYFLQEYTFFEKDDTHHCVGCDHWG